MSTTTSFCYAYPDIYNYTPRVVVWPTKVFDKLYEEMLAAVGNRKSVGWVCGITSTRLPYILVWIEIPSLCRSVEYLLVKPDTVILKTDKSVIA